MMAFSGCHWEIMSSLAVDKKFSTCCIDILRKKFRWVAEITVPKQKFKEEWITSAK
jgi:hypothetical protein